jgi:hypothetical protein
MGRRLAAVLAVGFMGCAMLSACSAHKGTVTGGIYYIGGPFGSTKQNGYGSGTVHVEQSGHVLATRDLKRGQAFRFELKPGNYDLVTYAVHTHIAVTANRARHVDLLASIR